MEKNESNSLGKIYRFFFYSKIAVFTAKKGKKKPRILRSEVFFKSLRKNYFLDFFLAVFFLAVVFFLAAAFFLAIVSSSIVKLLPRQ
jgi:hypothetical protein